MQMLTENCKTMLAFPSQTGGAITGDWVCLKGYEKARLIFIEQRGANATKTIFAVDKATTSAGANESAGITLKDFWYINDIAATPLLDTWTKGTAAASNAAVASTTQSVTCLYIVEIDPAALITTSYDFDWVQCQVASSNAAHYLTGIWELYSPRYAMDHASMPTIIA